MTALFGFLNAYTMKARKKKQARKKQEKKIALLYETVKILYIFYS